MQDSSENGMVNVITEKVHTGLADDRRSFVSLVENAVRILSEEAGNEALWWKESQTRRSGRCIH